MWKALPSAGPASVACASANNGFRGPLSANFNFNPIPSEIYSSFRGEQTNLPRDAHQSSLTHVSGVRYLLYQYRRHMSRGPHGNIAPPTNKAHHNPRCFSPARGDIRNFATRTRTGLRTSMAVALVLGNASLPLGGDAAGTIASEGG